MARVWALGALFLGIAGITQMACASTIDATFTADISATINTTASNFADWVVPSGINPTGQRMSGADLIDVTPTGSVSNLASGGIALFSFNNGWPLVSGTIDGSVESTAGGPDGPQFLVTASVPAGSSGILTAYIGAAPGTEIGADLADGSAYLDGSFFTGGGSGYVAVPFSVTDATNVELGIYDNSFTSPQDKGAVVFDGATLSLAVPEPASIAVAALAAAGLLWRPGRKHAGIGKMQGC
jgi:hypothetical protein